MTALAGMLVAPAMTPSPAQATHVDCWAQGVLTTDRGLGGPVVTTGVTNFTFQSSVAVCSNGGTSVTLSGTWTGSCLAGSGSGTARLGGERGTFTFELVGTTMVFGATTGDTIGELEVVVDALAPNNSCANGTAHQFLASGDLAFRG